MDKCRGFLDWKNDIDPRTDPTTNSPTYPSHPKAPTEPPTAAQLTCGTNLTGRDRALASCSRSFPSTTSYNNRPSHRATDPPTARRPIVGPMQLTETELWPAAAGLVPMQPSDNHPPSCNRSDNQFSDLLQPPQSPNRPSHRGMHTRGTHSPSDPYICVTA